MADDQAIRFSGSFTKKRCNPDGVWINNRWTEQEKRRKRTCKSSLFYDKCYFFEIFLFNFISAALTMLNITSSKDSFFSGWSEFNFTCYMYIFMSQRYLVLYIRLWDTHPYNLLQECCYKLTFHCYRWRSRTRPTPSEPS